MDKESKTVTYTTEQKAEEFLERLLGTRKTTDEELEGERIIVSIKQGDENGERNEGL